MLAKDVVARQMAVIVDLGRQALAGLSMEDFLASHARQLGRSPHR